ncbi:DNA polymerase III subunit epsilon [Candidatus Erwinia haradaeae]|uniref:DNA polymerase III subunit epsilon n=2 Tax=Candidatus Erwinia haradaeae TaxID=1922217 RepID=A0A451D8G4_9GAMM|nr:DNA polymerase III subunit epsilon [Candidatus Erwinia haradaeae]
MRQVVLDTETTGMNIIGAPYEGHRIVEIGAVEIINRRLTDNNFHVYLKPDREIDPEAFKIHGISDAFLKDKPTFSQVSENFLTYIHNAVLVMHNANFDLGFINYEFFQLNHEISKIEECYKIIDTLSIARKLFPGKRNNLDALCARYNIDNSQRIIHGALFDAKLLAKIFLRMTGGQTSFSLPRTGSLDNTKNVENMRYIKQPDSKLRIIRASQSELIEHKKYLQIIEKKGECLWNKKNKKK